jgi:predicted permease
MGLWSKVRNVFRGDVLNRELEEEFNAHIEEAVAAGRDRAEAKRAFGPMLRQREKSREFLVAEWMETLLQDLRYGVRVLIGSPLFTCVAVGSLALGIGANTAIFAVAKTVLLDTLPVKDPRELRLLLWTSAPDNKAPLVWGDANKTPDGRVASTSFSYPVFEEMRKDTDAVADLFGFKNVQVTVTAENDASIVDAELISGNAFAALGVMPAVGRLLSPSDDQGASAVTVISASYWASRFGRSPSVVGQVIAVNGVPVTIVGVAQERFDGLQTGSEARLFLPVTMQPALLPRAQGPSVSLLDNPQSWWLLMMARTRQGVSDEQAQQQLDARMQHAMANVTLDGGVVPQLHMSWSAGDRGLDYLKDALAKPSYILLALAGVVLLLACVNLANLLLARATAREREMSTRLALGAGRMRLVRQMVTESLLLSSLGGVAGLALGFFGRNVIPHLLATRSVEQMPIAFDGRIVLFTAAVSLTTGLLFGVFPAWQATRTTLGTALKDAGQGTMNRSKLNVGKILVVVQIGLSAVLLIGAGLFVRTLSNLMHTSLGFHADHLVLFHIKPPRTSYDSAHTRAFYVRMEERLHALPGVQSVAVSTIALVGDGGSGSTFQVMGRKVENSAGRVALTAQRRIQMNLVSRDYFATMGVGMVRGRTFDMSDTATSSRVAVVNETLAKTYFPHEDPIGQMFLSEDSDVPVRIVGVSADTSYANLRAKTPSLFYLLYEQYPDIGSMAVMVRTHVDPLSMAEPIRQTIAAIDPNLPVVDLRTMEDQIDSSLTSERTFARLTTGFGAIALLLAMVGIYGIMAYTVARRTNEIGLRMALGAKTSEVTAMVLREAGWLAVCGIGLGMLGAVALVRSVETMLYGLKPFDPLTLLGTALLLGTITLISAFGPAYRAAHIDPLRALRHE